MAPVGRWGKERSSLLAFGERRKSRHLLLFNPAAEAAVSLLGGVADREETLNTSRAVCGCLADAEGVDDRFGCSSEASWRGWRSAVDELKYELPHTP